MFKLKTLLHLNVFGFLLLPATAFAQAFSIQEILWTFVAVLHIAIPIAVGLAVVFFFWGLIKFLANADDENARAEGKKILIWGIIALFIILSFWGIVTILQDIVFPFDITDPLFDPSATPS